MKHLLRTAMLVGMLALAAAPAAALATQPAEPGQGHGNAKGPEYTPEPPGPKAPLPEQAKAYGRYCQEESKKHVAGTPGTPFSACVTAMAKAAVHKNMSPGRACKGTSGKHVKGEKGTPHSRCVAGVVKLRREQREAEA
ncbi:MAG: hypothetical protein ACM3NV_04985 [Syntrophothermus sp.]